MPVFASWSLHLTRQLIQFIVTCWRPFALATGSMCGRLSTAVNGGCWVETADAHMPVLRYSLGLKLCENCAFSCKNVKKIYQGRNLQTPRFGLVFAPPPWNSFWRHWSQVKNVGQLVNNLSRLSFTERRHQENLCRSNPNRCSPKYSQPEQIPHDNCEQQQWS